MLYICPCPFIDEFNMIRLYSLLSLFLLCCSCITEDSPSGEERIGVGDVLPDFTVTLNDGTTFSSEDLYGMVSLVVFFHTSCPDCQQELPVLQRVYENYATSRQQVRVVCISREEGVSAVSAYWKENGLSLPYSAQEDKQIYSLFADSTIPRIYVVDKHLTVQAVYTDDPLATYEDLCGWVDRLLAVD